MCLCPVTRNQPIRYSNNVADLENAFVHLTNVAVQKKSEGYSTDPFGGKWDLRHLKVRWADLKE